MDGYEATRQIRRIRNDDELYVVAITGHSDPEYIRKA